MRLGEVGPGTGTSHVGVVDEVLDVFVEHEGRHGTGTAHEMLDAQVQVARFQRLEVRVAERGLVIVDHKTRGQLAKGRTHHRFGPGGAHLGVLVNLVARMQAR